MSSAEDPVEVPGFTRTRLDFLATPRDVYVRGDGPAVIVMAEMPGITPRVTAYARRVADAGFTAFMPRLFGTPLRAPTPAMLASTLARICIRREFHLLAGEHSSPVVDWLRALARHAHTRCGGPGVGAVGMCITGNFALAMMLDAPVIAPVLSQPSLPLGATKRLRAALHASPAELAAAHDKIDRHGARILGLRFDSDPLCPAARFTRLREEFGPAFESIEIADRHANPAGPRPAHSVLTMHLIDEPGQPTRTALDRTLEFLHEQLDRDDSPSP